MSKSAAKRMPLSPKHARKGFYKGTGGTKQGTFSGRAGRFVLDKNRLIELVVPNLEGFKVSFRLQARRHMAYDFFFSVTTHIAFISLYS